MATNMKYRRLKRPKLFLYLFNIDILLINDNNKLQCIKLHRVQFSSERETINRITRKHNGYINSERTMPFDK